jgi:hypothetical protein
MPRYEALADEGGKADEILGKRLSVHRNAVARGEVPRDGVHRIGGKLLSPHFVHHHEGGEVLGVVLKVVNPEPLTLETPLNLALMVHGCPLISETWLL